MKSVQVYVKFFSNKPKSIQVFSGTVLNKDCLKLHILHIKKGKKQQKTNNQKKENTQKPYIIIKK